VMTGRGTLMAAAMRRAIACALVPNRRGSPTDGTCGQMIKIDRKVVMLAQLYVVRRRG
jgi:hypothetical protein